MNYEQLQGLRRSAEEQYDSLSDLTKWLGAIKSKESAPQQLTTSRESQRAEGAATVVGPTKRKLPPVRHYDSVSHACQAAPGSSKELTAEDHRQKGNDAYRAGDHRGAAKHYSNAIDACVRERDSACKAVSLSNRAQACLQLKMWTSAAADASAALRIEPSTAKTWLRRATALNALGHHAAAESDLQVALALASDPAAPPASAQVRSEAASELKKTQALIAVADERAPSYPVAVTSVGKSAAGADGVTTPPPIADVPISESSSTWFAPPPPPPPAPAPSPFPPLAADVKVAGVDTANATVHATADRIVSVPTAEDVTTAHSGPAANDIDVKQAASLPITDGKSKSSAIAAPALPRSPPLPFTPPRTSFELERLWRSIKAESASEHNVRRLSELLFSALDPSLLPSMYRAGMEPQFLGEVATFVAGVLRQASAAGEVDEGAASVISDRGGGSAVEAEVRELLAWVTRTPHFDLTLSMMDDGAAESFQRMIQQLRV